MLILCLLFAWQLWDFPALSTLTVSIIDLVPIENLTGRRRENAAKCRLYNF